jgi:hypothetical protein
MKLIRFAAITLSVTGLIFTSCKKDNPPPPNIVVDAGPSQTIQLPKDTVTLTGTVISGQSPTLVYSWTLIVGPNKPVILDSTSLIATATGLVAGTYIFQFEATNSTSTVIGEDTVTVVILPLNAVKVVAGKYQAVQLPIDTLTLSGTVTNGQTASMAYAWTLISGPNTPVIANSNSSATLVSSLVAGTYLFQFTATNTYGSSGVDTASVVVLPPVIKTLTLNPSDNPLEGHVDNYYNVFGSALNFIMGAWTIGGTPVEWRSYITFDQSGIPAGATITGATLYLYQTAEPTVGPTGVGGYASADNSGTANSYHIRKVTSSWSPSAMTWINQPSNTTADEVIVPQTNNAFENDTLDITSIVKDIQSSTNYGIEMGLENETYYNVRNYSTSYVSDPSLHPKLIISYY